MATTVAVLLAGGRGTRLYPASSPETPKQFRAVVGERSPFERTARRASRVADRVVALTRAEYADAAREAAPWVDVLIEPEPKDTGPALVYAAHRLRGEGDTVLCSLSCDHHVGDDAAFAADLERAAGLARGTDGLVTLGVEPSFASTGYGYIEPGDPVGDGYRVTEFVEKPDAEAAATYVERGYLWNAGTFVWRPEALLSAARDSALSPMVEALEADAGDAEGAFEAVEPVSVDHGVMEGSADVFVVPTDVEWDDLGTWDALSRVLRADGDGNVVAGEAVTIDANDNVLAADSDSHVSVVGVSGLVVAVYDGRVLVVPTDRAEAVRAVWDAVYG
jgi:mannose-1-phosphate guanylyltransferase